MTQPPDERDPLAPEPEQPAAEPPVQEPAAEPPVQEPAATPDSPTRAWSPEPPATEPEPAPPAPAVPESTVGWGALPPASDVPPPPAPPPASPPISADPATTPASPAAGWQQPGPAAPAPVVAWESPPEPGVAPASEGFVIAGAGARIVAYLIDSLLAAVLPAIATAFFVDYGPLFRDAFRDAAAGVQTSSVVIPVDASFILITLIGIAISYLYFVGFWTSAGKATPGMRGLKMQVVDVGTGQGLSIVQATKRWAVMGFPLSLLTLIAALQNAAGLIQLGVTVFLFFSVITNDRRQGIHDKIANALVIRQATSGDGATVVGCLVFGLLAIGFSVIITVAFIVALGPELEQILIDIGNSI